MMCGLTSNVLWVFCGCFADAMYCLHPIIIKYLDTYHMYGDC